MWSLEAKAYFAYLRGVRTFIHTIGTDSIRDAAVRIFRKRIRTKACREILSAVVQVYQNRVSHEG